MRGKKAARAAQNGAYPPDLSLMARARNPEYKGTAAGHGPHMLGDILSGYQAGGPDYLYALLTGYKDVPTYIREENGHLKPVGAEVFFIWCRSQSVLASEKRNGLIFFYNVFPFLGQNPSILKLFY